jgi:hypothetical protein
MTEATGASLPPPASPKKTNPWLIAVVVIVGAGCFCIGATGLLLAFGPDILHELGLYALLPSLISLP